jgi:hypothetical protein
MSRRFHTILLPTTLEADIPLGGVAANIRFTTHSLSASLQKTAYKLGTFEHDVDQGFETRRTNQKSED